jgi:hypothetical protein
MSLRYFFYSQKIRKVRPELTNKFACRPFAITRLCRVVLNVFVYSGSSYYNMLVNVNNTTFAGPHFAITRLCRFAFSRLLQV